VCDQLFVIINIP